MENLALQWSYQERMVELNHRLITTTIELERARVAAREESRKHYEITKQLLQSLQIIRRQRDEACVLLLKLGLINNASLPIKDGGNYVSPNNSSPAESNASFVNSTGSNIVAPNDSSPGATDRGLSVIDHLASGRALPQRGNFSQAVSDAGPLLERLLLRGPMPRKRVRPSPQPSVKKRRVGK